MRKPEQFRIISNMSKQKKKKSEVNKPEKMGHLSEKQFQEISEGYDLFQIQTLPHYSNVEQFSRQIQRVSNLQYEGLRFFTSGSSLAPKS